MTAKQLCMAIGVGILIQGALHLAWGPISIQWLNALSSWSNPSTTDSLVFFHVRLPRVLTAMAAGSGLALSGLLLQTWFHNPLAGPSVLGISAGSSLGVAVIILTGLTWGWWGVTIRRCRRRHAHVVADISGFAQISRVGYTAHIRLDVELCCWCRGDRVAGGGRSRCFATVCILGNGNIWSGPVAYIRTDAVDGGHCWKNDFL